MRVELRCLLPVGTAIDERGHAPKYLADLKARLLKLLDEGGAERAISTLSVGSNIVGLGGVSDHHALALVMRARPRVTPISRVRSERAMRSASGLLRQASRMRTRTPFVWLRASMASATRVVS